MTNETQQSPVSDQKKLSFGARLKSIREAKGMERKEVAMQLRLAEKKIAMMEYERYPSDLPVTFIRGYIRAYGRFLQVPEHDIKQAVELIKPRPPQQKMTINMLDIPMASSGHYFMHFFTFLIMLTLAGLVGMWWYTHSAFTNPGLANNQVNIRLPEPNTQALSMQNRASPPAPEEKEIQTEAQTAATEPNTNNAAFNVD